MRGKTLRLRVADTEDFEASMRPPHECGGKRAQSPLRSIGRSGFNEAPARMRGKARRVEVDDMSILDASMRPPHECGGKRRAADNATPTTMRLQ